MTIELKPSTAPAFLKMGIFGHTGTGKTWTAAQLLSQFISEYVPGSQLAMFDTEPSAGYVAPMVKRITGKDLLAVTSRSFSELLEFADLCREKGYVALLDSATHPYRTLVSDYLRAKASRVKSAGGNPDTVRLALKDWGPIKEVWGKFSEKFAYDPVHWAICGREGDVWEDVPDDEGEEKLKKVGVKMKTEVELSYEPSLLVRMTLDGTKHRATVVKERFGAMNGASGLDPDIDFFRPHLELLAVGGANVERNPAPTSSFPPGAGMNYQTIRARREAILEEIKDDLVLAYPGQTAVEKKAKVEALRAAFNTSSWVKLEKDEKAYPPDALEEGRAKLRAILKKEGH